MAFQTQKFRVKLMCYFSALKIPHLPYEKGRYGIHAFIFKPTIFTKHYAVFQSLSSRKNLLCFNPHVFQLFTIYDSPHQLCQIFNFEFKLTTLIRDLQSCFNRIVFENAYSITTVSSLEFSQ